MSFVIFAVVAILGGILAVGGDRLGRSLGKRRLTILHMRPRQTAEVVTFIWGFLIPILTLLLVMAISKDARRWIIDAPTVIHERDQLNFEVGQDKRSLDSEKTQLGRIQRLLDEQTGKEKQLTDRSAMLQKQVDQRTGELSKRTADLSQALLRFNRADQQYRTTQARVIRLQADYATVHKNYENLQKTLASDLQTYEKLKSDYALLSTQRSAADTELKKDRAQLADLADKVRAEQADLAKAKEDYTKTQDELSAALKQKDEVVRELNEAFAMLKGSHELGTRLLEAPVIFNSGDEVARIQVPGNLSRDQAASYLDKLLVAASDVAAGKGAARLPEANDRAAGFLPAQLSGSTASTSPDNAQEQFEQCVDEIVSSKKASVLVATAIYNSFKGVYVFLQVDRKDNLLAYKKNQDIAETMIHGSDPPEQIYEQISNFVKDKVSSNAKDHHMVPVAGSEDPLGEVPPGELLKVIQDARTWGRSARLVAVASQDTYAGDPLRIDLRLRP